MVFVEAWVVGKIKVFEVRQTNHARHFANQLGVWQTDFGGCGTERSNNPTWDFARVLDRTARGLNALRPGGLERGLLGAVVAGRVVS